ncbi:hypothetical protein SV7mr_35100 [Stieleria bergensis]|uniref:Sulfatase n=1 Tax=Stieleria bergensis TaxID=2528025 RepID=A0A517SXU9_9BACT|nr:hypothetical protein SV7mr_35100 [Planctomycetes bacterium SV_7m_r]
MINRRTAIAALSATAACATRPALAAEPETANQPLLGQAEHVISIWLGGGMGQIDTFDPKAKGDPKAKKPGSYYDAIETAVPDVSVCQHLPLLARQMEQVTAVRSVHHDVIDEHAAATNRMHTGRNISGTVTYPSIGSIIANQRGAVSPDVPPYVLIGYPNVTRGPGFLGSKDSYLYLTETGRGPAGLSRAPGISESRQARRESLLDAVGAGRSQATAKVLDYEAAQQQSLKLSGPEFNRVFQLESEPDQLRYRYGDEFGQRCLLSRRLIERGVRFVEVSHNLNFLNGAGWDVHNEGIEQQHRLIAELDRAVSSLMIDLQSKRLLDKTLIVITTEFGRPPGFDSGGGRGHQGSAFSCVLAGGGLNHKGAWGQTDALSKKIVDNPVSVPDFFATIVSAVGIDPHKNLYDGDRPVPITDQGNPIAALLS